MLSLEALGFLDGLGEGLVFLVEPDELGGGVGEEGGVELGGGEVGETGGGEVGGGGVGGEVIVYEPPVVPLKIFVLVLELTTLLLLLKVMLAVPALAAVNVTVATNWLPVTPLGGVPQPLTTWTDPPPPELGASMPQAVEEVILL